MNIRLKPEKVAQFLLLISVGLILANVAGKIIENLQGFNGWFFNGDSNQDRSILRFFEAVMLLFCSGLLFMIALAQKGKNNGDYLYWYGLMLIFLFLAITKETVFHESLAFSLRMALKISKFQFYAWAYGIVLVIFPAIYLKFFLRLPKRTMLLLLLGGTVFIIGAFGLDLIVAYLGKSIDHQSMAYIGLSALEDAFEMGGVIILVYGFLSFMSSELKGIGVRFSE